MRLTERRWMRFGALAVVPIVVAGVSTVVGSVAPAEAMQGHGTSSVVLDPHSLLRGQATGAITSGVESYLTRVAAVSTDDVWAAGWYRPTKDPSVTKPLAEHWDGTKWRRIPSPMPAGSAFAEFTNIDAVSATDVWAVGYYNVGTSTLTLLDHWNGEKWKQVVVQPPADAVRSIPLAIDVFADDDIWLVGYYSIDGTTNLSLTEHWDGDSWSPVASQDPAGSPDVELQDITVLSANDAWAVGFAFGADFATLATLTEHWDGTQWTTVEVPVHSEQSELISVAAISPNDLWATGTALGKAAYRTFVEHWDGSDWTRVPAPSPKTSTLSGLTDVTAVSADDIWGVGLTGQFFGNTSTFIEHWDGQAWSRVKSPNPPGFAISAMQGVGAVSGTDIWAVGVATPDGSVYHSLFEHWNGHKWVIWE